MARNCYHSAICVLHIINDDTRENLFYNKLKFIFLLCCGTIGDLVPQFLLRQLSPAMAWNKNQHMEVYRLHTESSKNIHSVCTTVLGLQHHVFIERCDVIIEMIIQNARSSEDLELCTLWTGYWTDLTGANSTFKFLV